MSLPARILTVDDEPDLIDLIRYHLELAGHEVITAASGWEALAHISRGRPDLVLLDLMLPDLDGFGVCEILRRDPVTATLPVIIISAWASGDSRNLGLELGALDYITKPFNPQEMLRRVECLLDQRVSTARNVPLAGRTDAIQ
jgi:DNA-binding response OmpR family regulator